MQSQYFWPIFGMVWIFGWVAAGLVWRAHSSRRRDKVREMVHRERMLALEKGTPLPELDLGENGSAAADKAGGRRAALALGLMLLFGGTGMMAAFMMAVDLSDLWPLGLIFLFIGVGLLLYVPLSRFLD